MLLTSAAIASPLPTVNFNLSSSHTEVIRAGNASYTTTQVTYYSQSITLEAGHMIFTPPNKTPLKMPSGKYALTHFIGDIVYADTHEPVPLSEVYTHHWTALSSTHANKLCEDKIEYTFGIGAESRNSPVSFPPGYGYVVPAGTTWGANIHLLRTVGLAGDNLHRAAKECNECYYSPGKGDICTPERNGTFECCGEKDYTGKMKCPTVANPPPPRAYQLRYTFNYTLEVEKLTPVQIGVLAAPNCETFYAAERNDAQPHHHVSYTYTIPVRASVLFAVAPRVERARP